MAYQKIKGTLDYIGIDSLKRRYIENTSAQIMKSYNALEVITPVFEQTEVFNRSSGEASDIVTKEMYTFLDKGKRSITLRPEGTASVIRCFNENKLYATAGIKRFYYNMPMYRYERPQAGRYREFVQFGVEIFGDKSPMLDCDCIILGDTILKALGLGGKYKIVINSIGNQKSRENYQIALRNHFNNYIDELCDDCKNRLLKNPMRILDCKVDKEHIALKNAPKISDYLEEESREYFNKLKEALDYLDIEYEVSDSLVRGLDYYTDTVFEFISLGDESDPVNSLKGSAVLAGGRYEGLVKLLGGPDCGGIGFAFGVERVSSLLDYYNLFPNLNNDVDLVLISLDDLSKKYLLKIAMDLRSKGIVCDMDYVNNNLKPQFKLSDRVNSKYIVICGGDEREKDLVQIKNCKTKVEKLINKNDIYEYIKGDN